MRHLLIALFIAMIALPVAAQDKPAPASIAARTNRLQKLDGYVPLYWQASSGKLLMESWRFNQEVLYQISLPAGLGSNPVGLDRGQMGEADVVRFGRIGPKWLMLGPIYS